MQIHIQRGQESFGPLSLEETTRYLARGDLLETDLAYHEGMNDWAPLGELLLQFGETKPATESTKPAPKAEGEEPAIFGQGRYQREKVLRLGYCRRYEMCVGIEPISSQAHIRRIDYSPMQ